MPQMKMNINASDLEVVKCKNCGCESWLSTILLRKVSPIQSPTGKSEMIAMQGAFICLECMTPLQQVIEEKAKEDKPLIQLQ